KMKDEHATSDTGLRPVREPSKNGKSGNSKSSDSKRTTHGPEARVTGKVSQSGKSKQIEFTHVDKMMFPKVDVTKGDLLKFYLEIADTLIPYLKSRPMTLERLPDGLTTANAPRFWQKN